MTARIAVRFARPETRATAGELLCGLLSVVERKNGWWLAEHAGHVSPNRMQRLLRTAVWDHDQARVDLLELVTDRLGHPDAIFVIDETKTPRRHHQHIDHECRCRTNRRKAIVLRHAPGLAKWSPVEARVVRARF